MSERIKSEVQTGSITYFCRSRGHGFIRGDDGEDHFVHVSDVESEFVPMKGDTVNYDSFFENLEAGIIKLNAISNTI